MIHNSNNELSSSSSSSSLLFIQHLTALTQPDTNTIRNAELALKPMLKDPRSIEALLAILISNDTNTGVRHIAAILLRKRVSSHYVKFDEATQNQIKATVLQYVTQESERSVRLGYIGVIGVLAKLNKKEGDNTNEKWPELFQFIGQAAAATNNAPIQELAFLVLEELTDDLSTALESALTGDAASVHNEQASQVLRLLHSGLVNSDQKVSAAAVKATGSLLSFLAETPYMDDPKSFASLLQVMMEVADRLKLVSEEAVGVTLDVLYDLVLSHCRTITANLEAVLAWSLSILTNAQLEYNVRDSAALVIATLSEVHNRKIMKQVPGAVPQIISSLYQLIEQSEESAAGALFENNPLWAEELEEELDGGDLDSGGNLTSMAQGTLDMICLHFPGKIIYPLIIQNTQVRLQNPNVDSRKSALACLGVAAEGTHEFLSTPAQLTMILPWILAGLADNEVKVREVACFALGQFAEHCQPNILKYSEGILPALYPLLHDPNITVQVTSCYVLEQFCERLEPKNIRSSLDALVQKLVQLLSTSQRRSIQEMSVAALSAVAVAAEEEFSVYLPHIAPMLLQLIELPIVADTSDQKQNNSLRGRALECFGHMAIACGKSSFSPYFTPVMKSAAQGLSSEDTDLHEFAYVLFANLAKVMEEEFGPVLPELVPHLLKVVESEDGALEWAENNELQNLLYVTSPSSTQENNDSQQFSNLDDSDDEYDNDNGNKYLTVRTALFDAKRAAVTALGEMSRYCGSAFCPYTESSLGLITRLLMPSDDQPQGTNYAMLGGGIELQKELVDALGAMVMPAISAMMSSSTEAVQWTKGSPVTTPALTPQVLQISEVCLRTLLLHVMCSSMSDDMYGDENNEVVGKAAESAQVIVDTLGCAVLVPLLQDAMQAAFMVLSGESHRDPDDDEEDIYSNASSSTSHLVSVCDLIGSFARVLGDEGIVTPIQLTNSNNTAPVQFLTAIMNVLSGKYGKTSSTSSSDRAMSLGLLGELCESLSLHVLHPHLNGVILPMVLSGLGDTEQDNNVRRNAAYLCGVVCETCGTAISESQYMELLQALSPLFGLSTSTNNGDEIDLEGVYPVVDNAAAAVARMITAVPSQVPLAQVLPTFLSVLPLKEDMTENGTVYSCIIKLLEQNNSDLIVLKGEVMRVMSSALAQEDINEEEELKGKLTNVLQSLQHK